MSGRCPLTVQLFLTCLCDALYGEVGIAATRILEHCGVRVLFPERQTCCGQPAFNSGAAEAAKAALSHFQTSFDSKIPIVTPSSSCAAMIRHGTAQVAPKLETAPVYELSEYLLDVLELDRWPLRGSSIAGRKRVAFHSACHRRAIGLGRKPLTALSLCPGYTLIEPEEADQCCGFGGTFSAKLGPVSAGIGLEKLRNLQKLGVKVVAGTDMGCLMHLEALATRHEIRLRFVHYAELMAEAIP